MSWLLEICRTTEVVWGGLILVVWGVGLLDACRARDRRLNGPMPNREGGRSHGE